MEFKQGEIAFSVHDLESSLESQAHLDENRTYFSGQCRKVFDLLMSGEQLTVFNAITNYGISSLPRRLADLALNGIKITNHWIKPENGPKYKVWYMTEVDKESNRKLI